MGRKKIKEIRCICGWCASRTLIINKHDRKKMIWLCENCQNINEAVIEGQFAIGKNMPNPNISIPIDDDGIGLAQLN